MKKYNVEEHVLPRPVELLPDYAHAKSRQTCAEKLVAAFHLTPDGAEAIANAVVDPAAVRKSIGDQADPNVEEIPVPGGTLLGIRTTAWSRRILADPRNPRINPFKKRPFAIDPGSGDEDSRFRPIPEPTSIDQRQTVAQLLVRVESRHHLTWASAQAARFVIAENDWRSSIASQGVMQHVWLVCTTYEHADGSAPATVLSSAEGSSRITAVHSLLDVKSADVPYDQNDAKMRVHVRKVNQAFKDSSDRETSVALRCERVPALILIGFRPHEGSETTFSTAVKSLVALRHVDMPKPWGDGPENESLADEVLDELHRQHLISDVERDYYAGSCTRSEARVAHLSDDPAVRASQILKLFVSQEEAIKRAIRVAITSQSTRKNITAKLCDELATALILRAVDDERSSTEQIRRYLKESFGLASHREPWSATNRAIEVMAQEALGEIQRWNADGQKGDPGPTSLELAVRAAYPLVVSGRLNADRGSHGNPQPDRRTPGEVLDAMRRTAHGIHQLSQAHRDFVEGQALRAVLEDGQIATIEDGSTDQTINDIYLRKTFPPFGKAPAPPTGDSPSDRLKTQIHHFDAAMDGLLSEFSAVGEVLGDDGRPLVETFGIESTLCNAWRKALSEVEDEVIVWERQFRKKHGMTRPRSAAVTNFDDAELSEIERQLSEDREEVEL